MQQQSDNYGRRTRKQRFKCCETMFFSTNKQFFTIAKNLTGCSVVANVGTIFTSARIARLLFLLWTDITLPLTLFGNAILCLVNFMKVTVSLLTECLVIQAFRGIRLLEIPMAGSGPVKGVEEPIRARLSATSFP